MKNRQQTGWKSGLQALLLAGCFLSPTGLVAADINWDELEEKAKRYTGEASRTDGTSQSGERDGGQRTIDLVIPSQPQGRILDNTVSEIPSSDKNYILGHMKLANRHFSRKNYTRAIEETELIFARQPDHTGARFMRAVIAGRLKDHQTAWHNILIARDKDPQNPKITTFINKLKTVAPEPQKAIGVPGVYRALPISASEKACDILESFLQQQISQNVVNISTGEFIKDAAGVTLPLTLDSSANLSRDEVVNAVKKASGDKVEIAPPLGGDNAAKHLELKIFISDLAIENKNVKPASELREFVKGVAEEVDVAISDTVERDAENKVLDATYDIAVRDFKSLNNFLRKISPYAHKFRVLSMKLAFITGSQQIIWKCKVQVFYQQT